MTTVTAVFSTVNMTLLILTGFSLNLVSQVMIYGSGSCVHRVT
jgi:hypothetical protein